MIATLDHVDVVAGSLEDDLVLYRRALGDGMVDLLFEWHHRAASPCAILGEHELGRRVIQPVPHRVGGKPAKDHSVDRTDARARQHGHCRFGDHSHVNADSVALGNTERPHCVC